MPRKKCASRVTLADRAIVDVQAMGISDPEMHREECRKYLEDEHAGEDEFSKLEDLLRRRF